MASGSFKLQATGMDKAESDRQSSLPHSVVVGSCTARNPGAGNPTQNRNTIFETMRIRGGTQAWSRVRMRVRSALEACTGVGQDEFTQLHSAQGQHAVRHRLEVFAFALHDDDFKAVMMIQMNMRCRKDHCPRSVLHFSQFLRQIWNVMVVIQGQGADNRLVRFNDFSQQRLTDKIAERL